MRPALLLAVVLAVPALAACTENAPSGGGGDDVAGASRALTVSSTDSACDLSATQARAHFCCAFAESEISRKAKGSTPGFADSTSASSCADVSS